MSAPDWLPLWTDKAAYPSPDSLEPWQWAWEFLRRNPEYQKKWNKVVRPLRKKGKPIDRPRLAFFKEEFGITFPWNPALKMIIPLLRQYAVRTASFVDFEGVTRSVSVGDYEFAVVFDLTLDVDTQVESARRELHSHIQFLAHEGILSVVSNRNVPDLWSDYLRLLDAEARGATQDKMAKTLYPNVRNDYPDFKARKTVQTRLNSAHKMRDKGYRFIRGYLPRPVARVPAKKPIPALSGTKF